MYNIYTKYVYGDDDDDYDDDDRSQERSII